MQTITLEQKGDIAIVRLNHGLTNPVGPLLVDDLHTTLDMVKEQSRAMVLCGGEKFFSIGLDLPQLLELERDEMTAFWYRFNGAVLKLYTLPVPTVCAVQGHAPGAGAILALACDYRFVANEKALLGFNEIQLGIPAPYIVHLMLRQMLSQSDADDLLYEGALIPPEKAAQIGLVTGVFPKPDVTDQAVKKLKKIIGFVPAAIAATKSAKTENVKMQFEKSHAAQHKTFIDIWFGSTAQAALKAALEKF